MHTLPQFQIYKYLDVKCIALLIINDEVVFIRIFINDVT